MFAAVRRIVLASALAAAFGLALAPGRADAARAVLAKDGTLYEVVETTYGALIPGASENDASMPVLALRTTAPGKKPTLEIVGGSATRFYKFGEQLEYDDSTQTVFLVYTSLDVQNFFADVHVVMRREDAWSVGRFVANPGQYFSVNPRILVTRQPYKDYDADRNVVTKTRTILSMVWWEESAYSQARYVALGIEDGNLRMEDAVAQNLNELAGAAGPTDNRDLPTSAYMWPSLQRDPVGDGGVLVSFANLATNSQRVLRIGFPNDFTTTSTGTTGGRASNSRTTPIGRGGAEFPIPRGIDLPFTLEVGTLISPALVPTYFWTKDGSLTYLTGDKTSVVKAPLSIPLRSDFQLDSALSAVRSMAEKQ